MDPSSTEALNIGGANYGLTCQMSIFHGSEPQTIVKGVAILDNGSGIALIDRRAVDKLNNPELSIDDTNANLSTINGPCDKVTTKYIM